MHTMMERRLIFALMLALASLFFLLPIAYADIAISNLTGRYNIAETLKPSVSITPTLAIKGFFSLEMACDNFTSVYYTIPITLQASEVVSVDVPGLETYRNMIGICVLNAAVKSIDGTIVDSKASPQFEITDGLIVELADTSLMMNPGDNLEISGFAYNARQESIDAGLEVIFGHEDSQYDIIGSEFNFSLNVPMDIKSGENKMMLIFTDGKGNGAVRELAVTVMPKAKDIVIGLEKKSYDPYDTLNAGLRLIDQAGEDMAGEIDLRMIKDRKTIFLVTTEDRKIAYYINNSLEPGTYKIRALHEGISQEALFEITGLDKVEYSLDGSNIIIANKGNTEYSKSTEFALDSTDGALVIHQKISIKPNEEYQFDLSRELPEGRYNVTLPDGRVLEDVYVDDERSLMKKAGDSISGLTGYFAKEGGGNSLGGILAMIIVIGVIVSLGLYTKRMFAAQEATLEDAPKDKAKDEMIDVSSMVNADGTQKKGSVQQKQRIDVFGAKDKADEDDKCVSAEAENKVLKQKILQMEKENKLLRGKLYAYERTQKFMNEAGKFGK